MNTSKIFYIIIGLTGFVTILVGMQIQDYITSKNHLWEDTIVLYLMIPAVILCFFAIGLSHKEMMNKGSVGLSRPRNFRRFQRGLLRMVESLVHSSQYLTKQIVEQYQSEALHK